jgi:uncharacterized RDD family membrane protein YckC
MIHNIDHFAASRWLRLANNLIDAIIIYVINQTVLFSLGHLVKMLGIRTSWIGLIFTIGTSFAYYLVFELLFNRTVGKFITKTIVVNKQGTKPTTKEIVIRSLCRKIPLDGFSFLFTRIGWHDSISNTRVIKVADMESIELENTIAGMDENTPTT